mmetsp:Transcript_5673/g.21395  ORF Transcript_5673/g.21395 Transcript_5673/m.21395 type:complete len:203 (-) Transcript_5673:540-1148(-)
MSWTLYTKDAVHASPNPAIALGVSVLGSTNKSDMMIVHRSLKGVQIALMMALVILTKKRLNRTTPTASAHTVATMGKNSGPNPPSSLVSCMRRAMAPTSVNTPLTQKRMHCCGAESSIIPMPVSFSGCSRYCINSSLTTSKPKDDMVRMKPNGESSIWPALMSMPPTDTTAAAHTVDHLNRCEPVRNPAMVTPTGRSCPVMA